MLFIWQNEHWFLINRQQQSGDQVGINVCKNEKKELQQFLLMGVGGEGGKIQLYLIAKGNSEEFIENQLGEDFKWDNSTFSGKEYMTIDIMCNYLIFPRAKP